VHPLGIDMVGARNPDTSCETVGAALIGVPLLSLTLISAERSLLEVQGDELWGPEERNVVHHSVPEHEGELRCRSIGLVGSAGCEVGREHTLVLLSDVGRVPLGEGAIANCQVGTTDAGLEEDCCSYARLELLAGSGGDGPGYVEREPDRELRIAEVHVVLDAYDLGIDLSRISTSCARSAKGKRQTMVLFGSTNVLPLSS
jgi:hypothetical protein